MSDLKTLYGLHPVIEALRQKKKVRRIFLSRSQNSKEILQAAARMQIPVIEMEAKALDKKAGNDHHQGVLAELDAEVFEHTDLDAILESVSSRYESGGASPLFVILDGIQDPHNLGAILRSAYAMGVDAVVIPDRRAARVSPAVIKASAGAALSIPIVTVTNVKQAIDQFRACEMTIYAATLNGRAPSAADLEGPLALVIGAEEKGVRPSVLKYCDDALTIPLTNDFNSLNASVAAGILFYEVQRQRT